MPRLSFEVDWVDAEGVNGPELSATWASLRILAGESVVTRVLDARAQTVRELVYVPLYPLAEWLVTNWWFLTRELGSPVEGERSRLPAAATLWVPTGKDMHIRTWRWFPQGPGHVLHGQEARPHGRTSSSWAKGISGWTVASFVRRASISSIE